MSSSRSLQRGLTLVELLVAMAVSLVVALAAISALLVSRQGFSSVDAASQLRDNARFATDLIQRLGVQAGYKDVPYATTNRATNVAGVDTNPDPNVMGFNNAIASATDPLNSKTDRTVSTALGYGSDVLILRYQTGETFPGSGVSDRTMIDCMGQPVTTVATNRDDRMFSVLHVGTAADGEPALMCTYRTSAGAFDTVPLISGVEVFQVLYGTDGVSAGVAPPTSAASAAAITDVVPDRYMRADQMTVSGNAVGTNANWRRVRSLRIGMVLRGPLNSVQDRSSQTFYPLGPGKSSPTGTTGSGLANTTADPNSIFDAPLDGRLRQAVTFTVHLRNDQGF